MADVAAFGAQHRRRLGRFDRRGQRRGLRFGHAQGVAFGPFASRRAIVAVVARAVLAEAARRAVVALSVLSAAIGSIAVALRAIIVAPIVGVAFLAGLVVAATLVTLSPWADSTTWKNSHGALWLGLALEGLKPILPQSLNVHIAT